VLARIPLHPAEPIGDRSQAPDPLFAEALFLASRHASPAAGLAAQPGELSSLAVTRRGYELRAGWRPTPHGSFAGVAPAGRHHPAQLTQVKGPSRSRKGPSC
jgi:lantibiotic biosynthesis protein